MRNAHHHVELITLENGMPAGMSLGFDFCAEHELGIDNLHHALGVGHGAKKGLKQYLAHPIAADDARLVFYERNKGTKTIPAETRLAFHSRPDVARELSNPKCKRHDFPPIRVESGQASSALRASWDKYGFCIRAFGEEERQVVRDLHAALLDGDLLISLGGGTGNPFARPGLCLTILSRMPQEVHDQVAAAEAEARALEKAVKKTRIHHTLEKAGRRFHALKPAWTKGFKTVIRTQPDGGQECELRPETRHPVMFFLNPQEQHRHNSGWYTVEELEAWARGEGPIIKAEAA